MIIRCRSKTGTARYNLQPEDDISKLLEKILDDAPDAEKESVTLSNQPRGSETAVSSLAGSLASLGIKHGDLLFVGYSDRQASESNEAITHPNGESSRPHESSMDGKETTSRTKPWETIVEDPVDAYWEAQDGKIKRKKDSRMCRHGDNSMCDHCMPVEPYDARYQAEQNIKHLSFHAYLRKLDISTNQTTATSSNTFIPPLEEPNYKVRVPCSSGSHPSWPAGICTKCQPSAVTLALQQFRMVDHVEFASPALVDNLLDFWRRTRMQRFGWLLGRYEPYNLVPMGVKAVVEAIHEPPQEGDIDGIKLGVPWEDQAKVESLASMCGMKIIGMIFTDLIPDQDRLKEGKVLCKRHKNSFFLSSLEAVYAAREAKARPNASRFSASGHFSSKFVTCVVTGNLQGDVAVEAYQVSDQAMAMVEADMIEASVDPGVVRIKDDTSGDSDAAEKRYIPDIFYTYKNQYNLQVKESAKPCFPTDYLCVSLTNGFPNTPSPLFVAPTATAFPTENRPGLHDQTLDKVVAQMNKLTRSLPPSLGHPAIATPANFKGKEREFAAEDLKSIAIWLSDWHLLAYLDTVGIFDKSDMTLLARVAIQRRAEDIQALVRSPAWQTLLTIASEHASAGEGKATPSISEIPDFPTDADGFPIIPEDHDMMRTDTPHSAPSADVGSQTPLAADPSSTVICPHCTFENPASNQDCEICSLPLR